MSIKQSIAEKIDELNGLGFTKKKIAEKVGLSEDQIYKYQKGILKIDPEEPDEMSPNFRQFPATIQKKDILADLKTEMKEYLDKIMENYNVELTRDDLEFFKKDIILQVKEEVNNLRKEVERLNKKLEHNKKVIRKLIGEEKYREIDEEIINEDNPLEPNSNLQQP